MKYFIVLLLMVSPIWASAFIFECPEKGSGNSFKIESQEIVKANSYGVLFFPENAAINVTEITDGFERRYTGNIIFQSGYVVVKHGRMAHYIFKLSEPNQGRSPFGKQFGSLVLSVNGIDEFENRIECFWL